MEVFDAAEQQSVEAAETETSVELNHSSNQHGAEVLLRDILNCHLFYVTEPYGVDMQLVPRRASVERGRRVLEQFLLQLVEVVDRPEYSSVEVVRAQWSSGLALPGPELAQEICVLFWNTD